MLSTISPWTKFFYFSHIFNAAAALGFVLCSYFAEDAERDTVWEFDLHITHIIALIYYITSGFLLLASVVGFLAQRFANKPSLWILYCILMSILSVVESALAGGALNKVGNHKNPRSMLRLQMEDYVKDDSDAAKRWDRLHIEYQCCGVDSYREWQDVPYGRTTLRTPKSCCLPPTNNDTLCSLNVLPVHEKADTIVYTRGCLVPAMKKVDEQLTIMGLFGLTISLLNIAFVSLTCFLVITKKV